MSQWIWSHDPLAVSRLGNDPSKSPLDSGALLALGIPACKVPRVQAELARLSARTPLDPAALPELARQIARQLC